MKILQFFSFIKFCYDLSVTIWKAGDKDTPKHTIFMCRRNVWLGGTKQDFSPSKPRS